MIHCNGGTGRASTAAAGALTVAGVKNVEKVVEDNLGKGIIKNKSQLEWLRSLQKNW